MTNLWGNGRERANLPQGAPASHQQGYAAKILPEMVMIPGRVSGGWVGSLEGGLHFFLYLRRVFLYYFS
jgi:hypothetical protein